MGYLIQVHRYELAVLTSLKEHRSLSLDELLYYTKLKKDEALWAVDNLYSRGAVEVERRDLESIEITDEGKAYAKTKMPEESLLSVLKRSRLSAASLNKKEEQIGFQWAKKKGLVAIRDGILYLTPAGEAATSSGIEEGNVLRELYAKPERYARLAQSNKEAFANLVKRGLVVIHRKSQIESIQITEKGLSELENKPATEQIDALSKAMIASGSWRGRDFKPYDVQLEVPKEQIAMRHPLRQTINKIRQTYLSMGFKEVYGPIIEPAFWVFDSLFMPQDHPAREMQDAFYLSQPKSIRVKRDETFERIRDAHLEYWGGEWQPEIAEQAMLRTHTTNVSARKVSEFVKAMGKETEELPIKLFSVGRVFRNENIDYKHLTDFYQTDGIVIGNNLTLANLFDILIDLYGAMGIKVKFKPAYFPFVEPGAEVYAYSEKTKEWIEVGGSGILRREVTGVPRKSLSVLAWGPGVERMLLLRDPETKSITELYNSDIGWLRRRRMV